MRSRVSERVDRDGCAEEEMLDNCVCTVGPRHVHLLPHHLHRLPISRCHEHLAANSRHSQSLSRVFLTHTVRGTAGVLDSQVTS